MTPISIIGAILIGVALGLTGAGGSVITLPVLVYLAGISPSEAVGMSLFVVGATASVGAIQRIRAKEFHAPAAAMFGASGAVGAIGGSRLTPLVTESILMVIFALLMLAVAGVMLFGGRGEAHGEIRCKPARCLLAGLSVGVLTGFIGVGGGFLLMRALIHFARLPVRIAMGTSLAIVAMNSVVGFLSHLGDAPPHWDIALIFAAIAIAGVLLGNAFSSRLPVDRLRQIFAFMVLATGIYVLWRSIF